MPEPATTEPLLLTVDQAAGLVGLCGKTLRREIQRGNLRAVRPTPGTIRIMRRDLDAWIASMVEA